MSRFFLVLLLGLSIFTRFYHLPARYVFGADEEYIMTYARTIVNDFHPIWIGLNVGDTGAYHGPYFIYFSALWSYFSHGDPLLTAYVAATLGVLTVASVYFIGTRWFGGRVGFLAAFFLALSPLVVFFDQKYWNPSPVPLLALWLTFALSELAKESRYILVIAFVLGAIPNTHFSLLPLYLPAVVYLFHYRRQISIPLWLSSIFLYALFMFPLVVFDYYHNYSNLLTPLRLLASPSLNGGGDFLRNFHLLGQFFARLWTLTPGSSNASEILAACRPLASLPSWMFCGLSSLPFFAYYIHRDEHDRNILLPVALSTLILSFSFVFYPRAVSEYYALGLIPFYFLFAARFFLWLFKPLVLFLLLGLFITSSFVTLFKVDESYGLSHKQELIRESLSKVGEDPYYLIEAGHTCHRFEGWRYLYTVYGRYPAGSDTDSMFGWLYPGETSEQYEHIITVLAPPAPRTGFEYFVTSAVQ